MIVWVPAPSCEGAGSQTRLISYLGDALPIEGPLPLRLVHIGLGVVGSIAAQGRDPGLGEWSPSVLDL